MINLYKPAIDQGIRMGIISIIVFLGIYAFDPLFFAKPTGMLTMLILTLQKGYLKVLLCVCKT